MIKAVVTVSIMILGLVTIPVLAQSGSLQLEGPVGSKAVITTYTDSEGLEKGTKLAVAELSFPLRVFEETPTGMLRIRHKEGEYWVASEDFRVRRNVKASCNFAMDRIKVAADRGANEGCVTAAAKR